MKNLSPKTIGVLFAIIGVSIFAFSDVCLKTTSAKYDIFSIALYMNIFTFLFLLPITWHAGGFKKVLKTSCFKIHAFRCYCMLVNYLCVIYAFSQLPLATAYIIIFSMPFIMNILAIFVLKEKIFIHRWMAIIIGIAGIFIAMRPDTFPMGLGVLAAGIGSFFNATGAITVKFIDKKDHWLSFALYTMIFQTPVIAAIVLYRGGSLLPDFSDWVNLPWFIAGGLAYAVALSLMPQAIKRVDASVVGSLIYIAFPWGILYGYFFFGDRVDRWTLAGAAVIIASGLYLLYRERLKKSQILEIEQHGTTR